MKYLFLFFVLFTCSIYSFEVEDRAYCYSSKIPEQQPPFEVKFDRRIFSQYNHEDISEPLILNKKGVYRIYCDMTSYNNGANVFAELESPLGTVIERTGSLYQTTDEWYYSEDFLSSTSVFDVTVKDENMPIHFVVKKIFSGEIKAVGIRIEHQSFNEDLSNYMLSQQST